jgi:hypothetical protein
MKQAFDLALMPNGKVVFDSKTLRYGLLDCGNEYSNTTANVLFLMLADKIRDTDSLEKVSSKLAASSDTKLVGQMYLAKYYEALSNYDVSLSLLLQILKSGSYSNKEEEYIKSFIFREYVKIAELGRFDSGKTIHYEGARNILSNSQVSILFSCQALFEKEHGAHDDKVIPLMESAYKLDQHNVDALIYAQHIMANKDFDSINKDLIDVFHHNPHIKIIETLVRLNTTGEMSGVLASLQKVSRFNVGAEMLYGLVRASVDARLLMYADEYMDELECIMGKKISPRIGRLKVEIELAKTGMSDEVFRIQKEVLESGHTDVFRCKECGGDCRVLLEYCRICGAIRSLEWKVV